MNERPEPGPRVRPASEVALLYAKRLERVFEGLMAVGDKSAIVAAWPESQAAYVNAANIATTARTIEQNMRAAEAAIGQRRRQPQYDVPYTSADQEDE